MSNRIHPAQLAALADAVTQLCADTNADLWAQTPYLNDGALCTALWSGPGLGERVVTHLGVTEHGTPSYGPDVVAVHSDLLGLRLTELAAHP